MKRIKRVHLLTARERAGLTQYELEHASGVDRTRISTLERDDQPLLHDTYVALDAALRKHKGLRRGEILVFGPPPVRRREAKPTIEAEVQPTPVQS